MLSNSFSRDLGLSGEPQSPDMVPQFRARRRERVSFSPIQGTVAEPESPTFGGAMAATPDLLSAPLHIGMSMTPDLSAPLRAPPMRDMQPHAQPMRDSSDDFELSPDNFGDLNIDDGEPLFDFSPGPNRTPSPELDQMDQ